MLVKKLKKIEEEVDNIDDETTEFNEVVKKEKEEKKISYVGQRGGYRHNAGRPKGGENDATKKKKEAEALIKERVVNSIKPLLDAQMNLAQGCQILFKVKKKKDKNGRETKEKPVVVNDPEIIASYLAGELDYSDDEYFFITTEKPDNKALDSLFNRVFGKPKESVAIEGNLSIEDIMIKILQERRGEK